jgi:hypothetical protein
MAYTFLQLKRIAEHALGSTPDSRISSSFIVNEAIQHLTTVHPWQWRKRFTLLTLTADQASVALPATCGGEILSVAFATNTNAAREILQVSYADFMELQRRGSTGSNLYYCLTPNTDGNAWQLNLYPTPESTESNALRVSYDAILTRYTDDDSVTTDDTKVVAIPRTWAEPLIPLVRAKAQSLEVAPDTPEWQVADAAIKVLIEREKRLGIVTVGEMYSVQRAQQIMGDNDAAMYGDPAEGTVTFS